MIPVFLLIYFAENNKTEVYKNSKLSQLCMAKNVNMVFFLLFPVINICAAPNLVPDSCYDVYKHFIPLRSKDRVPFSKTNMYKPLLENTFTLLKLAPQP